jgi:hypothetical protein
MRFSYRKSGAALVMYNDERRNAIGTGSNGVGVVGTERAAFITDLWHYSMG